MKKTVFVLLLITACAAVGHVVNPNVNIDGTQDIYVRSNPPGADCVVKNDAKEFKIKTPSYVTVKANGDLKINCTYQGVSKTCSLSSYPNWVGDEDPVVYFLSFKKTKLKEMEAGNAYDNYACLDFNLNINDGNCDDAISKGSPIAQSQRKNSICGVNPNANTPNLMQDNTGKCLVPGAYCLN